MIYCCLTLQCMGHSDNLIKFLPGHWIAYHLAQIWHLANMTPGWNKTRVCFESCLQVIGGQRCCYRRDSVVGHNLSPFLLFGHGKREGVSLWFYDCDIDKLMHRFYDIDKLMNRCCDIELLAILPLGLFVLIIILFIGFIAAGTFDKKYCYKCTKRGLNLVK